MSSKSSNSSNALGNNSPKRKKQISPAKRWSFTINNYTDSVITTISSIVPLCKCIIVGKEIGEKGTPHLQGYCEFLKKCRPLSYFKAHFEKSKGTKQQNYEYCSKDGNIVISKGFPAPLKLIKEEQFYNYQKEILEIVKGKQSDRIIYWYWETEGNTGKSALTKFLCAKHNAIILSNKATDMKNGILQRYLKTSEYPDTIIIDIPRSVNLDYLSYTGIEEVKNGCFFSPKYEGGMCLFNSPHLIIFSNEEPDLSKLSLDRWKVKKIKVSQIERDLK